MLERLFPEWCGKVFVLALLGFATTDFIITMTLSAADAAAHFVHNPFAPKWLSSQMLVTLLLLAILGAIFLKGFKEAINIAVVLVAAYLVLNAIVTVRAVIAIAQHPEVIRTMEGRALCRSILIGSASSRSACSYSRAWLWVCRDLKQELPLCRSSPAPTSMRAFAIRKKLLTTAAGIMSVFLIATSFVTTVLIPPQAFADGGEANGRAMAYLAHQYFGSAFGSVYDISTILILAFAGASAMAGLLNLIPRYLPRFGMAPEWARAARPLVLVFMGVAFFVTFTFHANVDAQGGAYATGVLVLITSAACAVTLAVWQSRLRWVFVPVTLIFIYTTGMNIWERPEGLKISCIFIATIMFVSFISRATRSTELRITGVDFSEEALSIIKSCGDRPLRIIPRRPKSVATCDDLDKIEAIVRKYHALPEHAPIAFLEVERTDASEFNQRLSVDGQRASRALHSSRTKPHGRELHRRLVDRDREDHRASTAYLLQVEGRKPGSEYLPLSLPRRRRRSSHHPRGFAESRPRHRSPPRCSCQLTPCRIG